MVAGAVVDCAEGTTRQFTLQPRHEQNHPKVMISKVTKIFITHMHADHIMGIVPLLRNVLFPPTNNASSHHQKKRSKVEIYGPSGIRNFVRQIMKMTLTCTSDTYVVHELLTHEDSTLPCNPADPSNNGAADPNVRHSSEEVGTDILCSPTDGLWRNVARGHGAFGEVQVDAGPIAHRDPCIGYVFRETAGPQRKLVILGDTHDPSAITPLCSSPSLLIHEATDSFIPTSVDPKAKRTETAVQESARARGHSTPTMAGTFARTVNAERLVLNHIGGRFPAPRYERDTRTAIMREIEAQATRAWGSDSRALAAWDFMRVLIPVHRLEASVSGPSGSAAEMLDLEDVDLLYMDPEEGSPYTNNTTSYQWHGNNNRKKRR